MTARPRLSTRRQVWRGAIEPGPNAMALAMIYPAGKKPQPLWSQNGNSPPSWFRFSDSSKHISRWTLDSSRWCWHS